MKLSRHGKTQASDTRFQTHRFKHTAPDTPRRTRPVEHAVPDTLCRLLPNPATADRYEDADETVAAADPDGQSTLVPTEPSATARALICGCTAW